MILGTVTGQIWGTRKVGPLSGLKLALVRPDRAYEYVADHLVCVDEIGARVGQQVVVCMGAPPRWRLGGDNVPVDAAVAALVDRVEVSS